MPEENKNPIDFESTLAELETLIQSMEQGELSLEHSLQEFERGITLTRLCQKALVQAQQRVSVLTEDGDTEFSKDA